MIKTFNSIVRKILLYISYFVFTHVFGWRIKNGISSMEYLKDGKYIIVYDHACIYEPLIGRSLFLVTSQTINTLIKKELTNIPLFDKLFMFINAFPIDILEKNETFNIVIDKLKKQKKFIIGIVFKEKKKLTNDIKFDFYNIARKTGADIISLNVDFINKEISTKTIASSVVVQTTSCEKIKKMVIDNFKNHNIYDQTNSLCSTKVLESKTSVINHNRSILKYIPIVSIIGIIVKVLFF